jgi:hypothetical protein
MPTEIKYTGTDANIRKLREFEKNPNINPFSGKKIKKDGPTYKKLMVQLEIMKTRLRRFVGDYSSIIILMNEKQKEEFKNNPNINPITGKRIKKDGPTYKRLMKQILSSP